MGPATSSQQHTVLPVVQHSLDQGHQVLIKQVPPRIQRTHERYTVSIHLTSSEWREKPTEVFDHRHKQTCYIRCWSLQDWAKRIPDADDHVRNQIKVRAHSATVMLGFGMAVQPFSVCKPLKTFPYKGIDPPESSCMYKFVKQRKASSLEWHTAL